MTDKKVILSGPRISTVTKRQLAKADLLTHVPVPRPDGNLLFGLDIGCADYLRPLGSIGFYDDSKFLR
jgi:hypothetical protein